MGPNKNEELGTNEQIGNTAGESSKTLTGVTRREWFRTAAGGCAGLALGTFVDVEAVRASTQMMKLSDVNEFTTSCNFCSCGCGMVATVHEGKLITMEGDYDHIVNRGSLCVKGISMFATHTSPNRLTTPRYRAPGSDHWEDISWDDAISRVAALAIEGENFLRIDYCQSCGAYLKTYNGSGSEQFFLADWTSLHLDIIARDRGLNRVAASLYEL